LLKPVVKGLTTIIIFFLLAEIALAGAYTVRNALVHYVPLPYAFGDDYGPTPPWFDHLQILTSDPQLVWRMRPNVSRTYLNIFSPVHAEVDRIALLRRFTPTIPSEFSGNPTWDVRLNSQGFRGPERERGASTAALRIACVGDSWTFGMPVNENETYPARLAEMLRHDMPGRRFDVQNVGVLGYSSFQGVQMLKRIVQDRVPDVVVIGFGMNDSEVAGYRDKDMVEQGTIPSLAPRIEHAIAHAVETSEDYRLLKYAALAVRFHPKPIETYLQASKNGNPRGAADYDSLEPWTRVAPRDYERNMREMIGLAREHGAKAVLLDNELWEGSPYRATLRRLSVELDVPLVDSFALIADAREKIERELESQLGLHEGTHATGPVTPASGTTTVIFRVSRGDVPVARALSIVGSDPALGNSSPNTVMMRDDGAGGDERSSDGVWSYAATLGTGQQISYVYTNSGAQGRWEGLDVPHIRQIVVPASKASPIYLPIETFGRVSMQADDWHTNSAGYELIARAVDAQIERLLTK